MHTVAQIPCCGWQAMQHNLHVKGNASCVTIKGQAGRHWYLSCCACALYPVLDRVVVCREHHRRGSHLLQGTLVQAVPQGLTHSTHTLN